MAFAGRQGVAYRHILLLAVSLKFSKSESGFTIASTALSIASYADAL